MKKETFCALLADLDERYIAEARTAKKTQHTAWIKWGAAAACLCAVAICAFSLQQQSNFTVDPVLSSSSSQGEDFSDGQYQNQLIFNHVNIVTADIDVQFTYYDELSEEEKAEWSADFERAFGFPHDALTPKLSAVFSSSSFYTLNAPDKASASGYSPHDYLLSYQAEDGRSVAISLCATGDPLRCYVVLEDEGNPQPSMIADLPVYLYSYGDSGFFAQFHCAGIGVDVDTKDISQNELETLLSNLIQLLQEE